MCTPICSPRGPLGALYNDAGLTRARVDAHKQENAAVLCAMLGMLLTEMPRSRGKSFVSGLAAPHPAVTKAARILSDDPTLSASDLAANLLVSPSRFARVFKGEMGVSLVRYRNQLRLERFVKIMDGGRQQHARSGARSRLRKLRPVSSRVPGAARNDAARLPGAGRPPRSPRAIVRK